MTVHEFRRAALGLRDAVEGCHMGHPDFRINNRIFASLNADQTVGTVKLTPDEQHRFVERDQTVFEPAAGAWGLQGWTKVHIAAADSELVGEALTLAWQAMSAQPAAKSRRASAGTRAASRTRPVAAARAADSSAPARKAARKPARAAVRSTASMSKASVRKSTAASSRAGASTSTAAKSTASKKTAKATAKGSGAGAAQRRSKAKRVASPASARVSARQAASAAAARVVIDDYIARCEPAVRTIMNTVRDLVRKEAPAALEKFSYRMPAFELNGMLIYYAPFKNHLGVFPPVKGDAALDKALAPYRGEKGNLRFPFDRPIPYPLIRRVVRARVKDNQARLASR